MLGIAVLLVISPSRRSAGSAAGARSKLLTKVATQGAAGNDPRRSAATNRVRSEAVREGHRREGSWAREHPGRRDKAWFKREIVSRLDAFMLEEIAAATCLSLAAWSRIRAGAEVPHPRHWEALLPLTQGVDWRRARKGEPDGTSQAASRSFFRRLCSLTHGATPMNRIPEIDPQMDARAKECLRLYMAGDVDPPELIFDRPPTAEQKKTRAKLRALLGEAESISFAASNTNALGVTTYRYNISFRKAGQLEYHFGVNPDGTMNQFSIKPEPERAAEVKQYFERGLTEPRQRD